MVGLADLKACGNVEDRSNRFALGESVACVGSFASGRLRESADFVAMGGEESVECSTPLRRSSHSANSLASALGAGYCHGGKRHITDVNKDRFALNGNSPR